MRHSCFVPFKKFGSFLTLFRPTSALLRFVRLFLGSLFGFLDCSLGRPFCAPMSCSGRVHIKCAKLFGTQVKHLPQVSIQFPNQVVTFVEFSQSNNVVSKLLCPWSGINCQLSVDRYASVFVQTCLLPKMPPALSRLSEDALPFFWPSRNVEFRTPLQLAQFQVFDAAL